MIRSIFSFPVLMILPFNIYAQWTEVASPTDNIIYDITFSTHDQGWAVGLEGTMLHYNGVGWEVYDGLAGNSFNRVVFTVENEGWAITGEGKIFRYDGNTWSPDFTVTGGKGLHTLYFLDTGEGYATGADGYLAYYDGTKWIEGNIGFDVMTLSSYFTDNKNGWLSGGAGEVFQLKDSVWSRVALPGAGAFFEMKFLSPDNGYGVGFGNAVWHYDGNSWGIEYESESSILLDIYFLDENHGWASGQGSLLTYQYGVWKEENMDPNREIWDFHFTDPYHGWAVGGDGLLLQYAPEPLDWQPINEISSDFYITEISRNPNGELYAIGYKEGVLVAEGEAVLYKSSDGLTWERVLWDLDELSIARTILAMQGVLLVSGVDKDFNFRVYKSVDDGLSWTVSSTGMSSQTHVQGMAADENGIVYAISKHFEPEFYRSDDLGDSWTLITTNGFPVPANPADGDFLSIAAVGTKLFVFHIESENNVNAVYTSTDGTNWTVLGNTWEESYIVDMHVAENGFLYASGATLDEGLKGFVYVSADQGNSWQLIDTDDLNGTAYVSIATLGSELFLSEASDIINHEYQVYTTLKGLTQNIDFAALPSKTYGDTAFELSATASSGLPVEYQSSNPEVATVTGNSINIAGAGVTTITASQPGNASFQEAGSVEQQLTVDKATLSVGVTNVSRDKGEINPVFALVYAGWVNDDNVEDLDVVPTASTLADMSSPAGAYAISISGGMDNDYQFSYTEGILTVTDVEEVITGLEDYSTKIMEVFPNPVSGRLKLIPGQADVAGRVVIHNSAGAVIKNQKFGNRMLEMDFSSYPAGIYVIKVVSAGKFAVYRVVKE